MEQCSLFELLGLLGSSTMLGHGYLLTSTGKTFKTDGYLLSLVSEHQCSVLDSLFLSLRRDLCCNHVPLVLCSWQTWRP